MASTPAIAATEITAGGYIRLRREAAGISIHSLAVSCTSSPIGLPAAIAAIEAAEADRETLQLADLRRLSLVFAFVPGIYLALAQGIPAGDICRGCGCTWTDPCIEPATGCGCAWTDGSRSFCTACRAKSL